MLSLTGIFYLPGRFLGVIGPTFVLAALLSLIFTRPGLIGTLARVERRLLFIEIGALSIVMLYIGGM